MADGYQLHNMEDSSGSFCGDDFNEEHVWNVVMERKDHCPKTRKAKEFVASSVTRLLPTAAKMIPRSQNVNADRERVALQSAPMKVPEWPKIYRKNVGESNFQGNRSWDVHFHDDVQEEDDFDKEEDGRIPPHEWAATRHARSQIYSFSMCEGAGRTLKGRDLSRVRNAVLARTGFLE